MRKLIKADSTEIDLIAPRSMSYIRELIGADATDQVRLPDGVHVMIVDDLGHRKNLPVNEEATAIYLSKCIPGTTHQIRGDVVIVPDEDFAL